MAGDRRATAGNVIAHRSMEKVFPADRFSAVAISGSAAMSTEMVRLFQVQLEHYEKVEGVALSLEGKANQLAQMVRTNLGMAMQGFVVVPLFCGYDVARGEGRIFDYDAAGGRYEEADFQTIGSGGTYATHDDPARLPRRAAARRRRRARDPRRSTRPPTPTARRAGPTRCAGIYPVVATVTAQGYDPARRRGRRGALRRDHRAAARRARATRRARLR